MKADLRKIWEYRGFKIVPVDCQHPTWGKCGEAEPFMETGPTFSLRYIVRRRYWGIELNGSRIVRGTKKTVREYIDQHYWYLDKHCRVNTDVK